jgi:hypothetical protein
VAYGPLGSSDGLDRLLRAQDKKHGPAGADYLKGKEDDMVHSEKMGKALMILERMVNQNAEDEIFQVGRLRGDLPRCAAEAAWLSAISLGSTGL